MNLYGYRVEEMPASIHTLYLDPDQIRAERQLRFVLFALMPRPLVVENNHHHNCRQMLTTPLFPPAVGTVCEVVLEPFLQAVLQHLPVDPIDVKPLIWSGRSTSGGPFGHSRRPAGTGPGVPFVLVELRELDGLRVLGWGACTTTRITVCLCAPRVFPAFRRSCAVFAFLPEFFSNWLPEPGDHAAKHLRDSRR